MFIWKAPLSFENFNNSEKQITQVYTNLMPIICKTINDEVDNEQNTIEKNEKNKKLKHKVLLKALQVILQQVIIPKSQYLADHTLTSKSMILSL